MRRVVVGFSGGVTSAWCGGWALSHYPKEEVAFLFHDTKEEDADTYRFLHAMADVLGHPITERSDGRSLTDLMYDHNMIPNNRVPFCSEELKGIPGKKYIEELKASGVDEIVKVYGFSANEPTRVQRHTAMGWQAGFTARFPMIEDAVTKQDAATWCQCTMGVPLPSMYEWSDHANCPGCFRGGKAYWLAVKTNRPDVFEKRKQQEQEFGHTISGRYSLIQIEAEGLKHAVGRRESIDIGPCECGG